MTIELNSNGPEIDRNNPQKSIESAWDRHRQDIKVVNPANKRKYTVIVVGTGLAGASAAATLGELGYNILNFCYQDSPRRAHSGRRSSASESRASQGRRVSRRASPPQQRVRARRRQGAGR